MRPLGFSEFIKSGGSAKCLTLRVDGEEAASWKRNQRESTVPGRSPEINLMNELYILRHGIAVDPGTPGIPDDERPLTPKGEKRMRQIARGLAPAGPEARPDRHQPPAPGPRDGRDRRRGARLPRPARDVERAPGRLVAPRRSSAGCASGPRTG